MSVKAKILVVENETAVAMLMVFLLTKAGCDVSAAHSGKEAMELALETKFDLITLAVDLPDIKGFEICSELKQRHFSRHMPVVFVSAQHSDRDMKHGFELGAVDYIAKPFDPYEFARRILSHLTPKASAAYTDNPAPIES
jgi:DNA-binding response OmpR family regulator